MPVRAILVLTSVIALAGIDCAAAGTLDDMLPRGDGICYGATPADHPSIRMVRVTRPERFQSYDSPGARMVRIVINFRRPAVRLEDTASCRGRDDELVCVSTSCDGTEFRLQRHGNGYRLMFDPAAPRAIWSCSEGPLRALVLSERDKVLPVERGKGACIDD